MKHALVAAAMSLAACDGAGSSIIVQLTFGGVPCESGSRQATAGAIIIENTETEAWAPQACGDSTVTIDRTIDERYRHRLATILLANDMPHELESTFESVDPSGAVWHRLFDRLYERNLVAL